MYMGLDDCTGPQEPMVEDQLRSEGPSRDRGRAEAWPLIWSPDSHATEEANTPYHYWIGDGRDGRPAKEHILCVSRLSDEEWREQYDGAIFNVTITKTDVQCQECLELIHS